MPVYLKNTRFGKNIIFVHIPRTGGVYAESFLSKSFDVRPMEVFNNIQPHIFGHYTYDNVIRTLAENACSVRKDDYFSFAFVRNPFDRILSSYLNYTVKNTPDFDDYIQMVAGTVRDELFKTHTSIRTNDLSHYIPQITMTGNNSVDFVGRFENYDNDLTTLLELSGIEMHDNVKIKKRNVKYRDYYGGGNRRIIEQIYRDDLEIFGYSF